MTAGHKGLATDWQNTFKTTRRLRAALACPAHTPASGGRLSATPRIIHDTDRSQISRLRARDAGRQRRPALEATLPHDEVIRRIESAWSDWLDAFAAIDDQALAEPGASGTWSPADLAFHLAFWDEQAGFDIQFRHDNNGDPPPPRDWQRMNEQVHARHTGRTPAEARETMRDTHEALLLLIAAHRDDDLTWLVPELVDHYAEHTAELRAWREQG